jgi:ribosomal protein S18 acetylase RimI-like enzyme
MGMSVTISAADEQDVVQILKLQYLCYQSEAELHGDYTIEPLTQTLEALTDELASGRVLVARLGPEVVASVRGKVDADGTGHIDKLIVHPRMRRHGLGGRLLAAVEEQLQTDGARRFELFTGRRSEHHLRLYRSHGYAPVAKDGSEGTVALIALAKEAPVSAYAATA